MNFLITHRICLDPLSPLKKSKLDPSDKTFWIRACSCVVAHVRDDDDDDDDNDDDDVPRLNAINPLCRMKPVIQCHDTGLEN